MAGRRRRSARVGARRAAMVDCWERRRPMPEPVESVVIDEELRTLVAQQAARRGMESVEDYIDFLIRVDLLQNRREEIEAKLLEALASGDPIEVTPAFWEERRRRLEKNLAEQG